MEGAIIKIDLTFSQRRGMSVKRYNNFDVMAKCFYVIVVGGALLWNSSVNISVLERRWEGFFFEKTWKRDFAVIVANLYGTKVLLSLFFVAGLVNAINRIIC